MSEERILPASIAIPPDAFQVRSYQAADRAQVLQLHAAVAVDAADCDCATNIDQIEEQYFRRPEDHFWVADAQGRIVGTVAICMHDQAVGHVHCLRAIDAAEDFSIRRNLVQVAASHARTHGCLKLVIHARADVTRAAQFLHRLGFEFSRQREIEKQSILEFYLNLYQPPELEVGQRDASRRKSADLLTSPIEVMRAVDDQKPAR